MICPQKPLKYHPNIILNFKQIDWSKNVSSVILILPPKFYCYPQPHPTWHKHSQFSTIIKIDENILSSTIIANIVPINELFRLTSSHKREFKTAKIHSTSSHKAIHSTLNISSFPLLSASAKLQIRTTKFSHYLIRLSFWCDVEWALCKITQKIVQKNILVQLNRKWEQLVPETIWSISKSFNVFK